MKNIATLILVLSISVSSFAQKGTAYNDRVLESKILDQTTHYSIYFPPGYETSTLDYPVLYLLHGGGDDWRDWLLKGQAASIADATIASGEAPEMIIVMPDGMQNWYNNKFDGTFNYEDYFFEELIPHIEVNYRSRTEKQYRAISGLSMGGRGCLLYSLKHPDMFQACYGMSIGMFLEERAKQPGWDGSSSWYGESYFGELKANGSLPDLWYENDTYTLAENLPDEQKNAVIYAVELGDDEINRDQLEMVLTMKENQIPVEFRVMDGGHNWVLWRKSLPNALEFVGQCFLQARTNPRNPPGR
jgi:enterochelin esterase-like enzyme